MNRKASRFLAYPYIIWMAGFTVIPLFMVFYYGLTDRSGAFTLEIKEINPLAPRMRPMG